MTKRKCDTELMSSEELRYYLWQISYDDPPFQMLGDDPIEAAMVWLSTKEDRSPVELPITFFFIDNQSVPPDHSKSGIIALTSYLLQRRDRERQRCGLPPYWSELVDRLEDKEAKA